MLFDLTHTDVLIQVFDLNSVSCLFLQTTCSHTVLPIHPTLWPGSVLSAVHLGHGASAWTAHHYGDHEPQTIGIGQSPVPLSKTGSYGKMREKILGVLIMKFNLLPIMTFCIVLLTITLLQWLLAIESGWPFMRNHKCHGKSNKQPRTT